VSTLPGGKLAPPPPVTRVAAGGMAFLVTAAFAFLWAGIGTLEELTVNRHSVLIIKQVLIEPYRQALADGLKKTNGSPIALSRDLVVFSVSRDQADDINVPSALAGERAAQLYQDGFPPTPESAGRTTTVLPRTLLSLMTKQRHENLKTAKTAALIGLIAGFVLCAVIATGASRFLLPGAAALLGYLLLRYHVRFTNLWVEPDEPGGLLFRGRLRLAVYQPGRYLLFVALSFLIAGGVFRALRGPLSAAVAGGQKAEAAEAAEPTADSKPEGASA
jgi:hypothetical protein